MVKNRFNVFYHVLLTGAYLPSKARTKNRTFFFSFLCVGKPFLNKSENILKIIAYLFGRCKYMPYIYNIIITQKQRDMKTVNDMNYQELEDEIMLSENGLYEQFDEKKLLAGEYTEEELREKTMEWIFAEPDNVI